MAFNTYIVISGRNNQYVEFDFETYVYRAIATTAFNAEYATLAITLDGYKRGIYNFPVDSYTPIYEGMANANDTFLPSGTNLFSLISSSEVLIIERDLLWTPPNLKTNINGTIKEFDKGWVNIDGQLKEIDKMWTRIDSTLKEI